jgi:very-short-patch-repair endonuclease
VVQELIRRARDPEASGQSVGIVTFNINQQHLIDDLLSEACAEDPALEQWVYGGEEPVFIKNLENVQGDERDVILFSIGYGPDETGKVSMNFGPLNREGGWRRLNVAVTRARREILVFSTLRADQIDLNRTGAEGVAALRSFLEYAGGRALALEETAARNARRDADGIAQSICRALQEAGYGTELSVGRSGYRVDVGVVDPEDPERYILGILLDGEGYGSAKSTRDREVAQQSVLEGLGWRIHRIWSMDWWDNSQREIRRVLELLRQRETPPPAETPIPVTAVGTTHLVTVKNDFSVYV